MAVLRTCTVCGRISDRARCEEHRHDRRPSAWRRGYDDDWEATRVSYRTRHPVCEWPGCSRPSVDIDHIDGSGPRGDNSDANLQALCKTHHSRKTVAQDGGFGRVHGTRRPL